MYSLSLFQEHLEQELLDLASQANTDLEAVQLLQEAELKVGVDTEDKPVQVMFFTVLISLAHCPPPSGNDSSIQKKTLLIS